MPSSQSKATDSPTEAQKSRPEVLTQEDMAKWKVSFHPTSSHL